MRIPPALQQFRTPDTALVATEVGFNHADLRDFGETKFLFLCFTNRCGSTYLASLLHSTGALPYPGEHLSSAVILPTLWRGVRSLQGYISQLPTEHGWIATKATIAQLLMLAEAGILDSIAPKSHFILLERQDKLAQAISRVIAFQQDRWTSDETARTESPTYNRAAIEANIRAIEQETAGFYSFFQANGTSPLHISYESVTADPKSAVANTATYLGLGALTPRLNLIPIKPQRGHVNREWHERYRSE
jgi:LPS sulfotransferase NodH